MKILIFSPLELPYTIGARYSGLERLSVQFAYEWSKLEHDVTLMAHKDTNVPPNIKFLPCEGYPNNDHTIHAEQRAFMAYQSEFYKFDIIWDMTHLQLPARFMPFLPTVNIFHANPEYAVKSGYTKAPYNLVSWSKWGVREIRKWFKQESRYQETIMVDPEVYKPEGERGDRFLTIGRMSPQKGNLNAIMLCRELGLPLDVAGGRGSEAMPTAELRDYEKSILDLCDGKQIKFCGEVSDEEKIKLMQTCKALLYITPHVEITSHKVQEAMLCGAKVLIPNTGGMPEIVTHGVDGFLCLKIEDYKEGIKNLDKLDPSRTREQVAQKYHPENVAKGYIDLMQKVADGERWK